MTPNRNTIPDALRNFDFLPHSAFIRIRVVQGLLACSRATVYRRISDGTLPPLVHPSPGVAAMNVGELRRFLAAKAG